MKFMQMKTTTKTKATHGRSAGQAGLVSQRYERLVGNNPASDTQTWFWETTSDQIEVWICARGAAVTAALKELQLFPNLKL